MKFVFETVILALSSCVLLSCILASSFQKAGGFNDKEKDDIINAFAVSGIVTLIYAGRLLYLFAVEAGISVI